MGTNVESLQIQTGGWTYTSELITSLHFLCDWKLPSCALLRQLIPGFRTETLSLKHSHTMKSKENFPPVIFKSENVRHSMEAEPQTPLGRVVPQQKSVRTFPLKVTMSYHYHLHIIQVCKSVRMCYSNVASTGRAKRNGDSDVPQLPPTLHD